MPTWNSLYQSSWATDFVRFKLASPFRWALNEETQGRKLEKSHVPLSKSHFATQSKEKQLEEFSKKKKIPAEAAKRKV